ncbi:MAG: zeta toxin family protein [Alphaproteobacteria bacterium]|nr:zeta toxin family protein [Alphaproteobacteria bacterium]
MLKVLMPSLKELVNSDYSSIKTDETETIINNAMLGLKSTSSPTLLQVSGIPGAGKSTYCTSNLLPNYLYLSFDKIMTSLKGYQLELLTSGNEIAFKKYEMTARIIGYELLNRALEKKLNIMFEHSGTNYAHLELFQNIKNKGYKTAIDFIVCDTNLAIQRAKERAIKLNRHVPEHLIIERASKFSDYMSAYQKITSSIKVYDGSNNFAPLKKI